jgi:hypothetical protein
MPTKKRYHKNNKSKRIGKNTKKAFFIGGTCSMCGACATKMVGGLGNDNPPSFQGLPLRYYYPTSDYSSDPNDPSAVSSVRIMPNLKAGSKKRNRSQKKHKQIQKKGGMLGFSYLHGNDINYNPLNTIGNLPSSAIASNIISGNMSSQNPSVLYQPVNDKYNQHNLPLA